MNNGAIDVYGQGLIISGPGDKGSETKVVQSVCGPRIIYHPLMQMSELWKLEITA